MCITGQACNCHVMFTLLVISFPRAAIVFSMIGHRSLVTGRDLSIFDKCLVGDWTKLINCSLKSNRPMVSCKIIASNWTTLKLIDINKDLHCSKKINCKINDTAAHCNKKVYAASKYENVTKGGKHRREKQ